MTAPRPRAPDRRAANWLAGLAGLGLGITIALAVTAESAGSLAALGGLATAAGRLAGLVAAYLMLITVLLVARIPALERAIGQDRLVAWHRRLGPWPLFLVAAHGVLITIGYAQAARTGVLHELWTLLMTYPGVLAATVGFRLLVAAGVTSYRKARRKLSYETWWTVHLYTYLALVLAFSHQVATGASFVDHPLAEAWWTTIWVGTLRSWSSPHRLPVLALAPAPRCGSVGAARGSRRRLGHLQGPPARTPAAARRPVHAMALPDARAVVAGPPLFGLGRCPITTFLRVTIKDLGDHSAAVARLRPGTRIGVEGPYGAFTAMRAAATECSSPAPASGSRRCAPCWRTSPREVDVIMLVRASTPADLVLRDEISELVEARGGRLHELVGSRTEVALDPRSLQRLVPDLGRREVYVCGPDGFNDLIRRAARAAGVHRNRFHVEAFGF